MLSEIALKQKKSHLQTLKLKLKLTFFRRSFGCLRAVKCSLSLKLELDIGLQFMASECFAWKAFVSSQELQFPEFLDQNLNLFPVAQLIFFW